MAQVTLEGLQSGSSIAIHYLMRPADFDDYPEKAITAIKSIIDDQGYELESLTIILEEHQKQTFSVSVPNLCKPVFEWFSRFFYANQKTITSRQYSESIRSLQKLYRNYSNNPDGWTIPTDITDELTKFNIKAFIQLLSLTDSLSEIGGYSLEDYVFFQSLLISDIVVERSFIITKREGKVDFAHLQPRIHSKKFIPCTCAKCGLLFLNQSHPKKLCKRCEKEQVESVKERYCECGCGKKLPEKYPQKRFFDKACVTRARRKREKNIISPSDSA